MTSPAGWHMQNDGRERYWDGNQWTDHFRDPREGGQANAPAVTKKGSKKHLIGYGATALVALGIGAAMGGSGTTTPRT